MTMIPTPMVMKVQSEKYKNISYSTFIKSQIPERGQFSHILMAPMAFVTCAIKVRELNFDSCDDVLITLAYKQSTSKTRRSKASLASVDKPVIYRKDLDLQIQNYNKPSEHFIESKPLLLNDLVLDASIGDSAIEPMFQFVDLNGSSRWILNPGAPYEQMSTTIGFSIFEAESIEEVMDSIIFNISNLFVDNIIPTSGITSTPDLLIDIQRYLHFYLYGD